MINIFTKRSVFCSLSVLMAVSSANAVDLSVSGYAKTDAIYDADQRQGDLSFAYQLATGDEANDKNGGYRMHARESRIRLTAAHDGHKVVAEGDFYGAGGNEVVSNSNGFRQRHFYGQSGNWLIGQTWSTFMDFMTYPKTLDFGGAPGVSFIRQAQARYTNGGFSFAIENPEAVIKDSSNTTLTSSDPMPDLIVKYRSEGSGFGYYAVALARKIEAEIGSTTESTSAFGIHAGAVLKMSSGARLGLNVITGSPGRYQQEKWGFADAILIGNDLEAIESTSYQLSFKQPLSDGSFNISYGVLEIDDKHKTEVTTVGGYEEVSEFHVNRLWNVSKKIELGVEVGYGERVEFNGDKGDNMRYQFAAKYSF